MLCCVGCAVVSIAAAWLPACQCLFACLSVSPLVCGVMCCAALCRCFLSSVCTGCTRCPVQGYDCLIAECDCAVWLCWRCACAVRTVLSVRCNKRAVLIKKSINGVAAPVDGAHTARRVFFAWAGGTIGSRITCRLLMPLPLLHLLPRRCRTVAVVSQSVVDRVRKWTSVYSSHYYYHHHHSVQYQCAVCSTVYGHNSLLFPLIDCTGL